MPGARAAWLVLLPILLGACAAANQGPRMGRSSWARPPISASAVRSELAAAVERGDRRAVTRAASNLAGMGAALSPQSQERLAPLLDDAFVTVRRSVGETPLQALARRFRQNGEAQVGSEIVAEVPAEHRIVEGIAWDDARDRLFAGSVVDRRLLVREDSAWRVVPLAAPVGGVFGMAVDPAKRLLWFASSAADPMPHSETAFSGLVAIDLDRLEEVRRVAVPDVRLGDVALAKDGTLFASDGRSGAIYRCRPGCAAVETLIPPGFFKSPQGMVVWPGGRRLYVADYAMGLFRVNLDTLRIAPIVARGPMMLEGIDGLVRYGDNLVAVQNGTRPNRIIEINLERGGRIASHVKVLEQGHPLWGEPTLLTNFGYGIAYVADGQWERYGPGGVLIDGGAPRPTGIRSIENFGDIVVTMR